MTRFWFYSKLRCTRRYPLGDFVNNSENKTAKVERNQQLSLFELSQESKEEKVDKKKDAIDNFCLYAPESFLGELEEIIQQWNTR